MTTTSQAQLDADEQLARQLADEDSAAMDIEEDRAFQMASARLEAMEDEDVEEDNDDNDSDLFLSSPPPPSTTYSSSSNNGAPRPSNNTAPQLRIDINTIKTSKRQESARARQEQRHGGKYGRNL